MAEQKLSFAQLSHSLPDIAHPNVIGETALSKHQGGKLLGQVKTDVCLPASMQSNNDERHGCEDIDHALSCAPVIVPRTLQGNSTAGECIPSRQRVLLWAT